MTLYDTIGQGYARMRRPDPRLAAAIDAALDDAASVVNVGAGAGSYEPAGRRVVAVEPSKVMARQRPASAAPCVRGVAEDLPLHDQAVDAAMAILSIHHWADPERGIAEMRRVARRRLVLLTWVPDAPPFWLTRDYFPEILTHDNRTLPDTRRLLALLERLAGPAHVTSVPIRHDCTDGFLYAYWRRPEAYLDPAVRMAISSFARIDAEAGLAALRADVQSGRWTERNGHLLSLDELDLGYRIVRCELVGSVAGERLQEPRPVPSSDVVLDAG